MCVCMPVLSQKHFLPVIVSSSLTFFLPDHSTNNARNKGENKRKKKREGAIG